MLTLQCLWCDHRNQAGSNFCNACGTPLYLRPCTHCDTVNQRAAVHCRNCGEAFSFDFVAVAEAESPAADPMTVSAETPPFPAAPRATVSLRASALAAGLIAAAAVSAYYAYRGSLPLLLAPERLAQTSASGAAALLESSPATPLMLPVLAPLPDDRPGASPVIRDDQRIRAVARRHAASARVKPPGAVHATKSRKTAPAVAGNRSRTLMAAATARSDRPICAEGVALSAACDVRTLAKGN